ncbi:serine protease inhibitor 42Dd-like [Haematobia irritans]|uniref:serine protease inhibitor 42Dd-like n=1 Tax=Haematobia irritans TaxID=7368 RepID=UPI003F507802
MSCRCIFISVLLSLASTVAILAMVYFFTFAKHSKPPAQVPTINITQSEFLNSLETFNGKLFTELSKSNGDKNIVYSPFSIETCLAMTRQVAVNQTALEIDKSFNISGMNLESITSNYHNILSKYENSSMLNMANRIYIKDSYEINETFNTTLSKEFYSSIENIDFSKSDAAIGSMNKWVELNTNGTIKDFIPPDAVNADTRIFLLSAIYFKGEWDTGFAPEATTEQDFYTNGDQHATQKVHLMFKKDLCQYNTFSDLDATVLRLPYKNSDLSMMILLPNANDGLSKLLEKLRNKTLDSVVREMGMQTNVNIYIPKFKVEFKVDLKDVLIKIGIKRMFSSGDFGNMLKTIEPIQVSNVMHKALIDVNEKGTEAAGASGLGISARSGADIPYPIFRADHPFYYAIINTDNVKLFEGTFIGA